MKTSLRRKSPETQSWSKTSLGTLPHEGACFGVDSLCALLVSILLAREEESVSSVFQCFSSGQRMGVASTPCLDFQGFAKCKALIIQQRSFIFATSAKFKLR